MNRNYSTFELAPDRLQKYLDLVTNYAKSDQMGPSELCVVLKIMSDLIATEYDVKIHSIDFGDEVVQ